MNEIDKEGSSGDELVATYFREMGPCFTKSLVSVHTKTTGGLCPNLLQHATADCCTWRQCMSVSEMPSSGIPHHGIFWSREHWNVECWMSWS